MKKKLMYYLGLVCPKLLTHILYFKTFHKILDLKNPKTINEKIHWIKFYGDTSQWVVLADKYRVREYVKAKGLSDILVKLYGCWDNVDAIDWDALPNEFVMKVNNGCGDVLICKDKSALDIEKFKNTFRKLLKETFGITTGQLQYKDIPACIIAEELLHSEKQCVNTTSLVDYKIWCFNGSPQYIFLYMNRNGGNAQCMVYDTHWKAHPEHLVVSEHFGIINIDVPKPVCFDEMLRTASILSEGHPEMRVDLYLVDNKIYFGELTMTAACGFMNHFTDTFLKEMGNKMVLPEKSIYS